MLHRRRRRWNETDQNCEAQTLLCRLFTSGIITDETTPEEIYNHEDYKQTFHRYSSSLTSFKYHFENERARQHRRFLTHSREELEEERKTKRRIINNLICGICLDNFVEPYSLGSCGHTFCGKCILPWLQTTLSCPTCRKIQKTVPVKNIALCSVTELLHNHDDTNDNNDAEEYQEEEEEDSYIDDEEIQDIQHDIQQDNTQEEEEDDYQEEMEEEEQEENARPQLNQMLESIQRQLDVNEEKEKAHERRVIRRASRREVYALVRALQRRLRELSAARQAQQEQQKLTYQVCRFFGKIKNFSANVIKAAFSKF